MRIDGVSPSNAYQRELRRSDPHTVPATIPTPDQFSEIDVIFDLTAEAAKQTGRDDIPHARQPRRPPETYTEAGTLAYSDKPLTNPVSVYKPAPTEFANDDQIPGPRISLVTFDGMLHAPARDQIRLLLD